MCTKTPKAPPADPAKKPQYLRNPLLDGLTIGQNSGRNSLRIDLTGSGRITPFEPALPTVPVGVAPPTRIPQPVNGRLSGLSIY